MEDADSESRESGYISGDFVQGFGRLDLNDDGKRDWEKEAGNFLNNYYPDWENPGKVYMVPPVFEPKQNLDDRGDKAEKDIYDLLEALGAKHEEPMFVVHSHKFTDHIDSVKYGYSKSKNWLVGEHDFIIIHRQYGLIFLQVKAGNSLKEFKTAQDQAQKDVVSVKIFLTKVFKTSHSIQKGLGKSLYKYPVFVVMPNCKKPNPGTSVAHDNGLFQEDCTDVESLRKWWCEKVKRNNPVDIEIYKQLLIRFVALVHVSPSLSYQIDNCHRQIVKFHTPEQLKVMMDSSPQQWIVGPAGSGKTVLLVDKVTEIASEISENKRDDRILVLCYNKPLSEHLRKTLERKRIVTVQTYDSFLHKIDDVPDGIWPHDQKKGIMNEVFRRLKRNPPARDQQYEHIFVDEGQDLYGENWFDMMKLYHNDSGYLKRRYYFWVMFDLNQHVQLSPSSEALPWKQIRNASRLTRVLRNTRNIFEQAKKHFSSIDSSEIQLGHNEVGLNVHWEQSLDNKKVKGPRVVANRIRGVLQHNVRSKHIVVLTRNADLRDDLMRSLRTYGIECQNAEDSVKGDKDVVIVESIRRFKGLESKVVILFDPQFSIARDCSVDKIKELLYTAVSRCFCYLDVISTTRGCKVLQSKVGTSVPYDPKVEGPSSSADQFTSIGAQEKEKVDHLFKNTFGKRSMDSKYESGPPEVHAKRKHAAEDDDDDDDVRPQSMKLSESEEKQMQSYYEKRQIPNESRDVEVEGSDLLEPGDTFITDIIRSKVMGLLQEAVSSNLDVSQEAVSSNLAVSQEAVSSNLAVSQEAVSPNLAVSATEKVVKDIVATIEYGVYSKHRHERNPRKYSKELRTLKKEIAQCNEKSKRHEVVWEAYKKNN